MTIKTLLVGAALLWAGAACAAGVDPLTATIEAKDAMRFAKLMEDGAVPAADVLQRAYLDGGGHGVKVFTPMRIVSAQNLARAVAAHPSRTTWRAS